MEREGGREPGVAVLTHWFNIGYSQRDKWKETKWLKASVHSDIRLDLVLDLHGLLIDWVKRKISQVQQTACLIVTDTKNSMNYKYEESFLPKD